VTLVASNKEDIARIEEMAKRVYDLFLERPEKEMVLVLTMLNLLSTYLKNICPNDIAAQDRNIEEFGDIIKLTLIYNKVRPSQ
jgi:hypothetical protein